MAWWHDCMDAWGDGEMGGWGVGENGHWSLVISHWSMVAA